MSWLTVPLLTERPADQGGESPSAAYRQHDIRFRRVEDHLSYGLPGLAAPYRVGKGVLQGFYRAVTVLQHVEGDIRSLSTAKQAAL